MSNSPSPSPFPRGCRGAGRRWGLHGVLGVEALAAPCWRPKVKLEVSQLASPWRVKGECWQARSFSLCPGLSSSLAGETKALMTQKRLQNHHVEHLEYTQSFVWEEMILLCRPRIESVNQMGPRSHSNPPASIS